MMGNYHVPCGAGEKLEITSNAYLLPTILEELALLLYGLKTPCYAGGSGKLLAMDIKKTPVVQ